VVLQNPAARTRKLRLPAQSDTRRGVESPLSGFGGGDFPVAGAEGAVDVEVEVEWVGSGIRGNKNPVPEKERTSTGEIEGKVFTS
jgi:hypothetical protein